NQLHLTNDKAPAFGGRYYRAAFTRLSVYSAELSSRPFSQLPDSWRLVAQSCRDLSCAEALNHQREHLRLAGGKLGLLDPLLWQEAKLRFLGLLLQRLGHRLRSDVGLWLPPPVIAPALAKQILADDVCDVGPEPL